MKTLEEQLNAAGLHVFGCCERLSDYGPDLLQTSQLLQDFTPAEADILGASMLLVRAEPASR
jgi:CRP/FNR family cyclic AMP-dependent transcriptional regulator